MSSLQFSIILSSSIPLLRIFSEINSFNSFGKNNDLIKKKAVLIFLPYSKIPEYLVFKLFFFKIGYILFLLIDFKN